MGLGAGMTVGQAWLLDDVISLVSTRLSLTLYSPSCCLTLWCNLAIIET
jgi:hypothetical protein